MAELIRRDRIIPNVLNPRTTLGDITGLTESVTVSGVLTPLQVCRFPRRPGYFLLLDGWRRWEAAGRAHLPEVPCDVVPEPRTPARQRVYMLVVGDQREELDPIDRAHAYGELRKAGMTVKAIAVAVGRSQSTISHHLALLDLDAASQQRVREQRISVGTAHEEVTKVRQQNRVDRGEVRRGAGSRPRWFTAKHPAAAQVQAACGHYDRYKIGGSGCGQCWQAAIEHAHALALLARVREVAEEPDGNWNGGDVVDLLTSWFTDHGLDITGPVPRALFRSA